MECCRRRGRYRRRFKARRAAGARSMKVDPMKVASAMSARAAGSQPEPFAEVSESRVEVGGAVGAGAAVAPGAGVGVAAGGGVGVGVGVGAAAAGSKSHVSVTSPRATDTPSVHVVTGGTPVPIATESEMRLAWGYCVLKSASVQGPVIRQKAPLCRLPDHGLVVECVRLPRARCRAPVLREFDGHGGKPRHTSGPEHREPERRGLRRRGPGVTAGKRHPTAAREIGQVADKRSYDPDEVARGDARQLEATGAEATGGASDQRGRTVVVRALDPARSRKWC